MIDVPILVNPQPRRKLTRLIKFLPNAKPIYLGTGDWFLIEGIDGVPIDLLLEYAREVRFRGVIRPVTMTVNMQYLEKALSQLVPRLRECRHSCLRFSDHGLNAGNYHTMDYYHYLRKFLNKNGVRTTSHRPKCIIRIDIWPNWLINNQPMVTIGLAPRRESGFYVVPRISW